MVVLWCATCSPQKENLLPRRVQYWLNTWLPLLYRSYTRNLLLLLLEPWLTLMGPPLFFHHSIGMGAEFAGMLFLHRHVLPELSWSFWSRSQMRFDDRSGSVSQPSAVPQSRLEDLKNLNTLFPLPAIVLVNCWSFAVLLKRNT